MKRKIPTDLVIVMNKKGYHDVDIIRFLKHKDYTPIEINDAFNQAKIKLEFSRIEHHEDQESKQIREISHEIKDEEKEIERLKKELENLNNIKTYFDTNLKSLNQRIKRQELIMGKLQEHLSKRAQENSETMKKMVSEIHALKQAFSKILEPLAHNVKLASGKLEVPVYNQEEVQGESEQEIETKIPEEEQEQEEFKEEKEKEKPKKSKKKKKDKPSLEDDFLR